MEYSLENKRYSLQYQDLKSEYLSFCNMSDEQFIDNIEKALHLACIICYLKGFGNSVLADNGIIHELVHLLDLETTIIDLREIREQFEEVLKLA